MLHATHPEIKSLPSSSVISFSMNEILVLQAWPLDPGEGLADIGTLYTLVAGNGGFVVRWTIRIPILTVVLRCSFSSARSAKCHRVQRLAGSYDVIYRVSSQEGCSRIIGIRSDRSIVRSYDSLLKTRPRRHDLICYVGVTRYHGFLNREFLRDSKPLLPGDTKYDLANRWRSSINEQRVNSSINSWRLLFFLLFVYSLFAPSFTDSIFLIDKFYWSSWWFHTGTRRVDSWIILLYRTAFIEFQNEWISQWE